MEFASFLAGEQWSDHPACTHPLLGALAREVNDSIDDAARREIASLVPRVIGLTTDDPAVDARLAREVALAALPIADRQHQRVAAVGLLRCEQVLNELEGRPVAQVSARVAAALDDVPDARDWARDYCAMRVGKRDKFSGRAAPAIVHSAIVGIATASVGDADQRLVALLRTSIALCEEWMGTTAARPASTDPMSQEALGTSTP